MMRDETCAGRWWRRIGWLLLLVTGFFLVAWYNQSPELNNKISRLHDRVPPGAVMPDFPLHGSDGSSMRLSSLRGQPVLLDFWASWCPPCRLSMPELVRLQATYKGRLVVLAINVMEPRESAVRFISEQDYPLRYAFADELAGYLGIEVLPSKVLLDARGRLLWAGVGHIPVATHLILERHL